jgi:tetratricopeptide (TPR) repeat protein
MRSFLKVGLHNLAWLLFLTVCGACASSGELANKGFAELAQGKVAAAEKKFGKAVIKDPTNSRASYGLCIVRRKQNQVLEALSLCKKALELSPRDGEIHLTLGEIHAQQLDYTNAITETRKAYECLKGDNSKAAYNLARFLTVHGESSAALDWLFLFYDRPSALPTYQARALREPDFFNLRHDERFLRWLSGIRRLKLSILGARAGYNDIFDNASDAYVSVSYGGKLLLYTDVIQDAPTPEWTDDYVIFDYRLGEKVYFSLIDHDISEDDYLGGLEMWNLRPGTGWYRDLIRVRIEDSADPVKSTGYNPPQNITPLQILVAAGIAYVYIKSQDELEAAPSVSTSYQPSSGTIATKLLSCAAQQGVSSVISNPVAAGAIAEALAAGLEDRKYTVGNAAKGAVVNYVSSELNRDGRRDLAAAVETGDLLLCALSALR